MESPVLAEKVFNPFNFPTAAPKIEPAQEAEEIKAVGPESVDSTESSTKDDSVLSEIEPPKKFHATVGPSLAKLDPAVARASQRIHVRKLHITQYFSFFKSNTCRISALRVRRGI